MPSYIPPLADMGFLLTRLIGLERLAALPGYEGVTPELIEAFLEKRPKSPANNSPL